jgi:hypothetical protein
MKIAFSTLVLVSVASLILSIGSANPSGAMHSLIHKKARSIMGDADTVKADTSINWEKMSKADRKQYMKDFIMPKMKPLLHDFDPKHFADVKCVTCHGNGARTGEFKMPNPQLPKLPASREGWDKLNKDKPKMMEFMSKTMKPTMADLLGMKPFDMKTGTGFGCGNCHTNEKK